MTLKIDFKKLKFIFVDFDGTLVDTIPILYDNYANFLKKYNREGSPEEFKSLMGPSIEEFVPTLKVRHGLSDNSQELISAYTHNLADRYTREAKLIKGARQFLEYTKAHGFRLTLVTSSAYPLIEGSLKKLNLEQYFEYMVTGEQVQKTKPDPEIYLLALKISSAKPEQTFTIEDSYNGILSSVRAHIPTVALQNEHLLNPSPEAMIVKNWEDLLKQFMILRNEHEK